MSIFYVHPYILQRLDAVHRAESSAVKSAAATAASFSSPNELEVV
jgi:hypothetical protein